MKTEEFTRRLSAILSADVVGYSRLMRDDEEATVRSIKLFRSAITKLVRDCRGHVVDAPGGNILAEFTSVVVCRDMVLFTERKHIRDRRFG
jgi:adenylate cyclase